MPYTLKRNAVLVLALAGLFWWGFMLAKHDPRLAPAIPFGEDPYDAVGSYGCIAGSLLAFISVFRAFRPRHVPASSAQCVYLLRSQEAVVVTVFFTVAADVVAMIRHPAMWLDAASGRRLVELLGALMVAAIVVQLVIRPSRGTVSRPGGTYTAAVTTLAALLVLAIYPEHLIQRLWTHLLTVLVGAIVLFAPMRALLTALVPFSDESGEPATSRSRSSTPTLGWFVALLVGLTVGALAFLSEIAEGAGAMPRIRLLLVASVFVGLGLAGILIAYAFLGRPLGLTRWPCSRGC